MEDHLQTIIAMIISVFLFFIFPVYMAYEKKDDVSYVLALKYTEEFVQSVQKNGYLTLDMYNDFKSKLLVTGNTYKIQMLHTYNKTEPIVNYYLKVDETKAYSTSIEKYDTFYNELDETDKVKFDNKYDIKKTYETYQEKYKEDYILNILNYGRTEIRGYADNDYNIYVMNIDDTFAVSLVNTNITPATLIFNMLAINSNKTMERIYVNYGGKILNSMKNNKSYISFEGTDLHSNICEMLPVKTIDTSEYPEETRPVITCTCKDEVKNVIPCKYYKSFTIEFEALPSKLTKLGKVGEIIETPIPSIEVDPYGEYEPEYEYSVLISGNILDLSKNIDGIYYYPLYISVGTNGVVLFYKNSSGYYKTILSYPTAIYEYTNIRIDVEDNIPKLYINGEHVVDGKYEVPLYVEPLIAYGHGNGDYYGRVKTLRMYTK